MVMPASRSSGALSIWSKGTNWPKPFAACALVIAAVSVVLPWSMCPIVPTLTCGFLRSNFAFAMAVCPPSRSWLTQLRSLREARPSLPERLGADALRHRLVVRELHREGRATLRARPEIRGIAEHLSEGRVRGDHLRVAARLLARDAAAASVDVADDLAHVLLRGHDLERHDGLEDDRRRFAHRLLEGHRARDLERDLRRIDLVVRAVDDGRLDVDDGVAGEHARLHRLLDALLDGGDVLARDDAALGAVHELEAATRRQRLEPQHDVAVLSAAARLADELGLVLDGLPDRSLVGNPGLADVGVHLELAEQPVDDDLEV